MSSLVQGANVGDQFLPKLFVKSASDTKERGHTRTVMSEQPSDVKIDNRHQGYDGLKLACFRGENSKKVPYAYRE